MRTIRGATGATYADSLALYNNALQTQGFYDSKLPYYKPVETWPITAHQVQDIESGEVSRRTLETMMQDFFGGADRSSITPDMLASMRQDPDLARSAKIIDNIDALRNNTDPNVELINDLVTGMIDLEAPFIAYNKNIKPQGVRIYEPKNAFAEVADTFGGTFYTTDLRNANELLTRALTQKNVDSIEKFDDLADIATIIYGSGKSKDIKKDDVIKRLNEIKDYTGLSEKEILSKIKGAGELSREIGANTPGANTTIPYYDPVMVKPYKDLTPSEQQERIQKATDSGNTGGLPPSVVAEVEKTIQSSSPQIQKTKQPMQPQPPADMQPMRSIPASQIEQVISQGLMPSRGMGVGPTRSPRPIMRQDPTVSRGQYQVGELYWDDSRKKWQRDMWDKDERKQSRKEAKPRQERWRTIKTPKF
jgi:hypothetical protein